MDSSGIAIWLDAAFSGFDGGILRVLHGFAQMTDGRFTGFFEAVSMAAEKGIGMFLLGVILFSFRKTRKTGLCVFGAVVIGAVATNLLLKDLIGRSRPFMDAALTEYRGWWIFVGAPAESGFSFPSGHVTAAMAAMTVLFFKVSKKVSWLFLVFVLLMGVSRCYLMVHYPSDVLGGLLVGVLSAGLSLFFAESVYPVIERLLPGAPRARKNRV